MFTKECKRGQIAFFAPLELSRKAHARKLYSAPMERSSCPQCEQLTGCFSTLEVALPAFYAASVLPFAERQLKSGALRGKHFAPRSERACRRAVPRIYPWIASRNAAAPTKRAFPPTFSPSIPHPRRPRKAYLEESAQKPSKIGPALAFSGKRPYTFFQSDFRRRSVKPWHFRRLPIRQISAS